MSHFYASVKGTRPKEVTRCGDKTNGLTAHVRGWTSGIRVQAAAFPKIDCFTIYATSGSDGIAPDIEIGYLSNGVFALKAGIKHPLGKKFKI